MEQIRTAKADDLPGILDLADRRRALYATFQPRFWKVAPNARERHETHLRELLEREDHIALVYERDSTIVGVLIGRLMPAPPVYDPGGPVFDVHDFVVADPGDWDRAGVELLRRANDEARHRGAGLSVVITGHLDTSKRAMIAAGGYSLASEWWVREL